MFHLSSYVAECISRFGYSPLVTTATVTVITTAIMGQNILILPTLVLPALMQLLTAIIIIIIILQVETPTTLTIARLQ